MKLIEILLILLLVVLLVFLSLGVKYLCRKYIYKEAHKKQDIDWNINISKQGIYLSCFFIKKYWQITNKNSIILMSNIFDKMSYIKENTNGKYENEISSCWS